MLAISNPTRAATSLLAPRLPGPDNQRLRVWRRSSAARSGSARQPLRSRSREKAGIDDAWSLPPLQYSGASADFVPSDDRPEKLPDPAKNGPLAGPAPGLTDPQNPSRQGLIPKLGHSPASPGQTRGVDGRCSRLPGPSPVGPSDPNDTSRFIQAPLHRARLPGSSRLRRTSEGNGFCNSDDGSEVLRGRGCGEPGFTPR